MKPQSRWRKVEIATSWAIGIVMLATGGWMLIQHYSSYEPPPPAVPDPLGPARCVSCANRFQHRDVVLDPDWGGDVCLDCYY